MHGEESVEELAVAQGKGDAEETDEELERLPLIHFQDNLSNVDEKVLEKECF